MREPLAHLPQLLCHGVVPPSGSHLLQGAVGEVAAAERLQALLQGTVQGGLGAGVGLQQKQLGKRRRQQLQPETQTATQLRVDDPCGGESKCFCNDHLTLVRTWLHIDAVTCVHILIWRDGLDAADLIQQISRDKKHSPGRKN